MKLPCAVVRDLLPLYAEKLTEEETNRLVDAHLQTCPECRQKLSSIETGPAAQIDAAAPLKELKKEIQRRRWFTALIASLCVFIVVYTYFSRRNEMKLIPWEDGLIEVQGIETRPVDPPPEGTVSGKQNELTADVLVIRADSRINGFQNSMFQADDGTKTEIIQAWSSLPRSAETKRNYSEQVFYPLPDRLIYSYEGQNQLLWGEPLNGGVEVLPRLALAAYVFIAVLLAVILGLLWFIFRRRDFCWIFRQLFFFPVSYLAAHLLIKGTRTSSFFLEHDLISIALITAAMYALLSLVWQVWMRRTKAA